MTNNKRRNQFTRVVGLETPDRETINNKRQNKKIVMEISVKRIWIVLGLLVIIAAGFMSCGPKKGVVATVGKEQVTGEAIKASMIERFRGEQNAAKRSMEDREKFVREYAIGLAKYQEATARGIDKSPEVTGELDKMIKQVALQQLYQTEVMDKVINDENARAFYDKSAQELRGRHILIKLSPVDSARAVDSSRVKARVDSITKAIRGGLDFKAAAKMFSEDATSSADSGDLGWFPWGRMVDEFQEAAWRAKIGEITGPIKTGYGYHLILIEEKRPVPDRQPFEAVKEQIKGQLREVLGEKLNNRARDFVTELRAQSKVEYQTGTIELFQKRGGDPTVSKTESLAPVFTEEQKKLTAATYSGGSVTLSELIDKLGTNAFRLDWNQAQSVTDLVNSIVEPKLLEVAATKAGLEKKAKDEPAVKQQRQQTAIRILEKTEITDKVNPSEEDVKRYFDSHLENYVQAEQRTVREIFIKDDSVKCAKTRERALKGEDFAALAKKFNEKESTQPENGRIGPFEQSRFGLIGRTAFGLAKVGDVSEVVRAGKNFSIVQLLEIIPSRTKAYEEAKVQVQRECRQAQTDAKARELEEMVLKKYPLKIDTEQLAALWPVVAEDKGTGQKGAREP
jgi:peptidyl-prolyl cis-trans isomerase C